MANLVRAILELRYAQTLAPEDSTICETPVHSATYELFEAISNAMLSPPADLLTEDAVRQMAEAAVDEATTFFKDEYHQRSMLF